VGSYKKCNESQIPLQRGHCQGDQLCWGVGNRLHHWWKVPFSSIFSHRCSSLTMA